jgi:hypothetical protein
MRKSGKEAYPSRSHSDHQPAAKGKGHAFPISTSWNDNKLPRLGSGVRRLWVMLPKGFFLYGKDGVS